MEKIYQISCAIFILCIMLGCKGEKSASLGDFDKEIYTPRYASGFDIKGADGRESVIISVKNPWQGADSVSSRLFISRNGESAPEGFDGQIIKDAAKRVVAMSSTYVAMLHAIDADSCVVGVSGIDFISNPYIQAHRDEIGDVGYDGNINYEILMSLDPDLVLLYGVSGASAMEGKLKELGIPFLYVGEYVEEDPLGKAEWIVAFLKWWEIARMEKMYSKIFP